MTPHASTWTARACSVKLVPAHCYSSSPGDRSARSGEIKAHCQVPDTIRAARRLQLCTSRQFRHRRAAAWVAPALPDQASTAAAATEVDPEAIRLMTAATILSASQSDSDADGASVTNSLDSLDEDSSSSLAMLDEMTVLNADSLALVVGILRQHQPLEADEADVQLSERLRDLLLLLRQRPASPTPAAGTLLAAAESAAVAAGADADADGFWAGPDEWADVRSALMSIGINASVDEEDDEDAWSMEEEGPARRTRLLRSLPRLDAETSAALAAFLAEQQQRDAANRSDRSAGGSASQQQQGQQQGGAVAVVDDEQEELWWDEVTQAYQQLWQQARLQQAKQTEMGEFA